MELDDSVLLQKQVKNNSEDLQSEFLDMKNWEEQMKRKDEELLRALGQQEAVPPIRSKKKKKDFITEVKQIGNNNKSKRIKSYDYSAWDKFDVDKACQELDKGNQSDGSAEEETTKEELETDHELATKRKQEGNKFVQQQEWDKAVTCYSEAIKLFPYDAVFYANRALCHLKMDNLYSAEADCTTAIQLDDAYIKAYHRRATARMCLQQYHESKEDLEKILRMEPSNKEAKSLLAQVDKKIKSSKPIIISGKDTTEEVPIDEMATEKISNNSKAIKENAIKIQDKRSSETVQRNEQKVSEEVKGNITQCLRINKETTKNSDNDVNNVKQTEKDPRIPDWLPEKDNVAIVEPITKLPHLRSKKPMTRITVQETEFVLTKHNKSQIKENSEDRHTEFVDVDKEELKELNNSCETFESSNVIDVPSIPRTAVQFLMDWRKTKLSEVRYKYLKQLPPNNLPSIFQDSMESNIVSEILQVLQLEFVKRKEPVYQYLLGLSRVKRFRALSMFMSNKEKEGLKTLLDYCKVTENKLEEVAELYNRYEV